MTSRSMPYSNSTQTRPVRSATSSSIVGRTASTVRYVDPWTFCGERSQGDAGNCGIVTAFLAAMTEETWSPACCERAGRSLLARGFSKESQRPDGWYSGETECVFCPFCGAKLPEVPQE